jgi:hypothetical protein
MKRPSFPRQVIVYIIVVLACAATSDIKAQDTPLPSAAPLPADIRQDAYALYSDLYRNANWLEPDELLAIAIGTASRPDRVMQPSAKVLSGA